MTSSNFYLSKYGFCPAQISTSIPSDLKIIVVIPCFNEENLFKTLTCFSNQIDLAFSVEIITVINASILSSDEIKMLNEENFKNGMNWTSTANSDKLKFHFILKNDLPAKHAGVGLARKIGMDEAVFRFHQIGLDGIIICADADALYENDFLKKAHDHFFVDYPKTNGCSIYFEHPLSGNEFDGKVYEAIVRYELFLRYYKNVLAWCGFPFSFHTIGSSMAVRSSAYQKSGGMNKRQAGEDFYFLQKIMELGNFTELNSTCVFPSPRPSNRVPFGTGRSVSDWILNSDNHPDSKSWPVYSIFIFDELKKLNGMIPEFYSNNQANLLNLHPLLIKYLDQTDFELKLKEIRNNSSSFENFKKRLYNWMNAFWILKASHFLRDEGMGEMDVEIASIELLKRLKINFGQGLKETLSTYRKMDRQKKG